MSSITAKPRHKWSDTGAQLYTLFVNTLRASSLVRLLLLTPYCSLIGHCWRRIASNKGERVSKKVKGEGKHISRIYIRLRFSCIFFVNYEEFFTEYIKF